jgi:hypothetical protein
MPGAAWHLFSPNPGDWQRFTLAFHDSQEPLPPVGKIVALRFSLFGTEDQGNHCVRFRDLSVLCPTPTAFRREENLILAGRVLNIFDYSPVTECKIICRFSNKELSVRTNGHGFYIFRDLPKDERCHLEVTGSGKKVHFLRGRVVHMTCDYWDWDAFVC